jgi:hypothetical protein
VLHAVRILAVSSICRAPAWLRISCLPGLRTKGPEERGWMKRAGPHLQIIGLMNNATLVCPVSMQCENEILEGHEQSSRCYEGLRSYVGRAETRRETIRNSQSLSRNNPSRINEL